MPSRFTLFVPILLLGVAAAGCAASAGSPVALGDDAVVGTPDHDLPATPALEEGEGHAPAAAACLAGAEDCADIPGVELCQPEEADTPCVTAPAAPPSLPAGATHTPAPVTYTQVEPADPAGATVRQVPAAEVAVAVETPTLLEVRWWSGVEPCYAFVGVDVAEDDTSVTVTVNEVNADAGDADGEPVACIDIALAKATTIELAAPVGDRAVVDGTTGEPLVVHPA